MAQVLHGATPNNMLPAFEGIMSVLNNNCSVPDLVELFKKCPKLSQGVIPKVLKEKIRNFEKSDSNFIGSVRGEWQVSRSTYQLSRRFQWA